MNSLRITCHVGDAKALRIQSTLGKTEFLDSLTDERVQWGRNDLLILKNLRDDPAKIKLKGLVMTDGDTVVRSSRKGVHLLAENVEIELIIDGGEVLTFRSTLAQDPKGGGQRVAA